MCEGRMGRERSAVREVPTSFSRWMRMRLPSASLPPAGGGGGCRRCANFCCSCSCSRSVAISASRRRRLSACSPILRSAAASCARHAASSLGGEGSSTSRGSSTRRARAALLRRPLQRAHCNADEATTASPPRALAGWLVLPRWTWWDRWPSVRDEATRLVRLDPRGFARPTLWLGAIRLTKNTQMFTEPVEALMAGAPRERFVRSDAKVRGPGRNNHLELAAAREPRPVHL